VAPRAVRVKSSHVTSSQVAHERRREQFEQTVHEWEGRVRAALGAAVVTVVVAVGLPREAAPATSPRRVKSSECRAPATSPRQVRSRQARASLAKLSHTQRTCARWTGHSPSTPCCRSAGAARSAAGAGQSQGWPRAGMSRRPPAKCGRTVKASQAKSSQVRAGQVRPKQVRPPTLKVICTPRPSAK
jgi:hypothetical protein